jgi:hypothetical protein
MENLSSDSIFNKALSELIFYNLLKISYLIIERKYFNYV